MEFNGLIQGVPAANQAVEYFASWPSERPLSLTRPNLWALEPTPRLRNHYLHAVQHLTIPIFACKR